MSDDEQQQHAGVQHQTQQEHDQLQHQTQQEHDQLQPQTQQEQPAVAQVPDSLIFFCCSSLSLYAFFPNLVL